MRSHFHRQQNRLHRGMSMMVLVCICLSVAIPAHAGILDLFGGGADYKVEVVKDSSQTNTKNLLSTQSTEQQTNQILEKQTSLEYKENVLDSIAWSIGQKLSQQMTSSIVQWINSGFKGSPAFVTDLDKFLLNAADEVAGEFIYGSELGFLCEPIEFQVRVALETQYKRTGRDSYEPQCTLSDVSNNIQDFLGGNFAAGGWPAFFELTVGSNNDPYKAYFNASAELNTKIANKQANEKALLSYGNGILSMKVCDTTKDANGNTRKDCHVTTPGKVIESALSFEVGEKGSKTLLQADEFNEIVSALLTQLSTQALSGANGLLGLGGNSRYSDNTFGDNGNQSYIEALAADDITKRQQLISNPIEDAIDAEKDYADLQNQILDQIAAVETEINDGKEKYPECFDLELSDTLQNIKDDATENLSISADTLSTLESMDNVLKSTPTGEQRLKVLNLFNDLKKSGALRTDAENNKLKNTFVDLDLPNLIDAFTPQVDDELKRCKG